MLKRYGEAAAGQWNSRWHGKWVWPRNFTDGGRTSDPSQRCSRFGEVRFTAIKPHKEAIKRDRSNNGGGEELCERKLDKT